MLRGALGALWKHAKVRSDVLRGALGAFWERLKRFLEALKAAEAGLAAPGKPQGRCMLYFHRF